MAREKYIPQDNQWISYATFDAETFVNDVNADLGVEVPLTVQSNGEVILDTADIPSGVTETDVKNAIKDNHPHR